MSQQYDHLMGTEQPQESHPDNSHTYKMAGEVVNFPVSMAVSDARRMGNENIVKRLQSDTGKSDEDVRQAMHGYYGSAAVHTLPGAE